METSESIKPDNVQTKSMSDRGLGSVQRVEAQPGRLIVHAERGSFGLLQLSSTMLRVVLCGPDATWPDGTIAIAIQDVSERSRQQPEPAVVDEIDSVHADFGVIRARIDRATCGISLHHCELGTKLENLELRRLNDGGYSAVIDAKPTTRFYGLGEKPGELNKRYDAYTMWNSDVYAPHVPEMEALYVSIPFVIPFDEGKATGLFLDNPGRSRFDFRSRTPNYEITADTGGFDLYVLFGSTVKDVVVQYTELTGRMPLPPKWALGYHQSRYSYETQEEVLALAEAFRTKQIPLDAIYLDIHYMDGYRVFTFDSGRFPDPKAMIAQLAEMGVKVVPIVDPGVKQDAEYAVYRDGVAKDVFCKSLEGDLFIGEVWPGKSAFPDFTDDTAKAWWADQHAFYVDLGIQGIWLSLIHI